MRALLRRPGLLSFTFALSLAAAACGDDPTNEGRSNIEGVVFLNAGAVAVRVDGLQITGTFQVGEGQESPRYAVQFIAEDGNRFTPTAPDQWLRVTVSNPGIGRWQQDQAGEFAGWFEGVATGTTLVGFDLMQGPVGSATATFLYRTPNIPLLVN